MEEKVIGIGQKSMAYSTAWHPKRTVLKCFTGRKGDIDMSKEYVVTVYSLNDPDTKVVIAEVDSIREGKAIMTKFRNNKWWNIERRTDLDTFDHIVLTVRKKEQVRRIAA
jgi:hypothetical protein